MSAVEAVRYFRNIFPFYYGSCSAAPDIYNFTKQFRGFWRFVLVRNRKDADLMLRNQVLEGEPTHNCCQFRCVDRFLRL
jgi:hypothetical protein